MQQNTFNMRLPVPLTLDELRAKGDQLATLTQQIEDLENERKAQAKEYRDKIAGLVIEARMTSDHIVDKAEPRWVECRERVIGSRVETVRLDTGEVVSSRPATAEEMQPRLFKAETYAVEGED